MKEAFMAKKMNIPKKIMGYTIPKSIRRSKLINSLLASKAGREMTAAALTAAATAAAGVLIGESKEIRSAAEKGAKKSVKGAGIIVEAMEQAFQAALKELHLAPKKERKDRPERSYEGAPVH
jgi:hypothetical protein